MSIVIVCAECGKEFTDSPCRLKSRKYCSEACYHEACKTDPVKTMLAKIDRSGGPDACWPYSGQRLPRGYGHHTANGKHWYAHRVAYEAANGPIPDGLFVCHKCDNPPCCNPAHFFLGTHADNMADRTAKGRHFNPPLKR